MKRVLIGFAGLIFSVIGIFVLLTCVLLASESSRLLFMDSVIRNVNKVTELKLNVVNPKSSSLNVWSIESLSVHKQSKPWIDVKNLHLEWRWQALFSKRISIKELHLAQLSFYSPSLKTEEQEEDEKPSARLPTLPDIVIENVNIDALSFVDAKLPVSLSVQRESIPAFNVTGTAKLLEGSPVFVSLSAVAASESELAVKAEITQQGNIISLEGSAYGDSENIVSRVLDLPEGSRLDAGFDLTASTALNGNTLNIKRLNFPVADRMASLTGKLYIDRSFTSGQIMEEIQFSLGQSEHTIVGDFTHEALNFDVLINEMSFEAFSFYIPEIKKGSLSADLHIFGSIDDPKASGSFSAGAVYENVIVRAEAEGSLSTSKINVSRFTLDIGKGRAVGSGYYMPKLQSGNFAAELSNLHTDVLKTFRVPIPSELNANIRHANLNFDGTLANPIGQFSLMGSGEYKSQEFTLDLLVRNENRLFDIKQLEIQLPDGGAVISGSYDVKSMSADLVVKLDSVPLNLLEYQGIELPNGLAGFVSADATITDNILSPRISGHTVIAGYYDNIPYRVAAGGMYANKRVDIKELELHAFAKKALVVNGFYTTNEFDFSVAADQFPSDLFNALDLALAPGELNLSLSLKGNEQTVSLDGNVVYVLDSDTAVEKNKAKPLRHNWNTYIKTESNNIILLSEVFSNDIKTGTINVSLPVDRYKKYLREKNDQKKISSNEEQNRSIPLDLKIQTDFDLAGLDLYYTLPTQRFKGHLYSDLHFGGDLNSPEIEGQITLNNGEYYNDLVGSHISQIECLLIASENVVSVESCLGHDANGGKISLHGDIKIPEAAIENGSINLEMNIDSVNAITRPEIDAIFSGAIQAKGDFEELDIVGDIDVQPLEISLESSFTKGFDTIKVTEVEYLEPESNSKFIDLESDKKDEGEVPDQYADGSSGFAFPLIRLDINASTDHRAFIRGRGLEADLKGDVHIFGPTTNLKYEGEIETVRGHVELFGKRFELTSGVLSLNNRIAMLAVQGSYSEEDQSFMVSLTGPINDLEIGLTSTPTQPESEILSQIIFGKSAASMSALEALQLATAIQKLRGSGGSGFDPIEDIRNILSVDTLSVGSTSNEQGQSGVSVGVGKYISDKVYLELESTPNSEQIWRSSIEMKLSPSLRLRSETGDQSFLQGFEFLWKRDY